MKERLQIVLRKNRRSGDLIQVSRKTEKEKICHSYQEASKAISEQHTLNATELFEIEWFDQMIKFFLERTNNHATDLERYRLFLPEKLYQLMCTLSIKCKEHNIDYRPMDSMMKSIINKIKATEIKLYEKTGETLALLDEINYIEPMAEHDKNVEDAKSIFKALLEIPDFFEAFNRIAEKKYHKSSTIKTIHFKGYAQAHHLPPKWVYACAIDVIAEHQSPLTVTNEEALYILWVKSSLRAGTSKQELIDLIKAWSVTDEFVDKINHYNGEIFEN